MEELYTLSRHLLTTNDRPYKRYLVDTDLLSHRCIILLGQRGVGKTTTLTQYLLNTVQGDVNSPKILYIPMDHILINNRSIYEIAEQFQQQGGETVVFDEIHKHENWAQELKSIYDTFRKLKVIGSGSSALLIHQSGYDLSRRALEYYLQGMSLREFIELNHGCELPTFTLTQVLENHEQHAQTIINSLKKLKLKIIPLFKEYLNHGYYPSFLDLPDEKSYWLTLDQNIRMTLESDLTTIYPQLTGTTIKKLKQLLIFIAEKVPFTPSWSGIKKIIDVSDDRTVKSYFQYLEDAKLICSLPKFSSKLNRLEKAEKIYLDNPNLTQAMAQGKANIGTLREIFSTNMLSFAHDVTAPSQGDLLVDGQYTIEIGGKSKSMDQVKGIKDAYVLSDDIELGAMRKVPLWLLGFLY